MRGWIRRIRGAVGLGLTWAAGWAPIGGLLGFVLGSALGGPAGAVAVAWVKLFAVSGFAAGMTFAGVVRVAEGRRRFDQLSLPRFAALGAAGGALLGVGATGLSILGAGLDPLGAAIVGTLTLLGAGSAAGSLVVARRADDRALLEAGEDVADVGLSERELERLLR